MCGSTALALLGATMTVVALADRISLHETVAHVENFWNHAKPHASTDDVARASNLSVMRSYQKCETPDACRVSDSPIALGKVPRITKVIRSDRYLEIYWQPAASLNSSLPINYYEISVSDPENPSSFSGQNVTCGPSTTLLAPRLSSEYYEAKIKASYIDAGGSFREQVSSRVLHVPPPRAVDVEVLNRTAEMIRFKIEAPCLRKNTIFEIESEARLKKTELGCVIEAFNLTAYETIFIDVRICSVDEGSGILSCGNSSHLNMTSNVASPSRLRDPEVLLRSASNLGDMSLGLNFTTPEFPRGPIDFHILSCKKEAGIPWYLRRLPVLVRESMNCSFAAVNSDLQDKRIEHVGEWDHLYIPQRVTVNWNGVAEMLCRYVFIFLVFILSQLLYLDEMIPEEDLGLILQICFAIKCLRWFKSYLWASF